MVEFTASVTSGPPLVDDPTGRVPPLGLAAKLARFAAANSGILRLTFADASGAASAVALPVEFVRAPELVRAALSPDGGAIELDFDQATLFPNVHFPFPRVSVLHCSFTAPRLCSNSRVSPFDVLSQLMCWSVCR